VYKLLQTSSSEELICEQLGRLSLSVVISPALDIVLAVYKCLLQISYIWAISCIKIRKNISKKPNLNIILIDNELFEI